MKVNTVSNLNFNAKIKIPVLENKVNNPYVCGDVMDLLRKYVLPGVFNNSSITLPDIPESVIGEIAERGITFIRVI